VIFRIALPDDDPDGDIYERMWVIVRERVGPTYLGLLDNEPAQTGPNDMLRVGSEVPFEPRHVIDARNADEVSLAEAAREPSSRWPRD
jgi:uncharacterized protein YegJ (DUF2314 family)